MSDEAAKGKQGQKYRSSKKAWKLTSNSTLMNDQETKQVEYVCGENEGKMSSVSSQTCTSLVATGITLDTQGFSIQLYDDNGPSSNQQ